MSNRDVSVNQRSTEVSITHTCAVCAPGLRTRVAFYLLDPELPPPVEPEEVEVDVEFEEAPPFPLDVPVLDCGANDIEGALTPSMFNVCEVG